MWQMTSDPLLQLTENSTNKRHKHQQQHNYKNAAYRFDKMHNNIFWFQYIIYNVIENDNPTQELFRIIPIKPKYLKLAAYCK